MSFDPARARSILVSALAYCRADAWFIIGALLILSLPQVAADSLLTEPEANYVALTLSLLTLYMQLLLTFRLLDRAGAVPGYHRTQLTEGRFLTAFAASILSSMGIVIGLFLLVVPGLIAIVLWSLTLSVIAAERKSPMQALRRSVAIARSNFMTLAQIAAVFVLVVAALVGGPLIFYLADGPVASVGLSLWMNVAISALLLFASAAWAAAYVALRPSPE